MTEGWAGRSTIRMEEVDSTNETAKKYACQGAASGTLFVAERQTAGKGRHGRKWEDQPGVSLTMSLLVRPEFPTQNASMVTLVTAMAVARAVSAVLPAQIKWPNDILVSEKKVCGILTELIFDNNNSPCLIIGVGVNVNNRSMPDELSDTATSLWIEKNAIFSSASASGGPDAEVNHDEAAAADIDRELLTRQIWAEFESLYGTFCETEDMSHLKDEYESRLVNLGRVCRFTDRGKEYTGVALGIDDRGRLKVRMPDDRVTAIDSGEVSVRGIYGYV